MPEWEEKVDRIKEVLEQEIHMTLTKQGLPLQGSDKRYNFDLVSPDQKIVIEVKTEKYEGGNPTSAVVRLSEACLLLIAAKNAKKRILVLTDEPLYKLFKEERQGKMMALLGIEIRFIKIQSLLNASRKSARVPAEACGIKVEGKNKWLTLIQNASKNH
ncbi:MAG: hypothetical protein ABR962_03010 [Candidatus Bathyarchaeia archaeon]|jgi:hypothetical protein